MSEQGYETARVEYFTASKVLVVGAKRLEGVDALLADSEIPVDSALLDYEHGDLAINFGAVVLVRPEKKIYDTPEGPESTYIVHMVKQESIQSLFSPKWAPGQLLGSILQMIRGKKEYDGIEQVSYNARTKKATLYSTENGLIELDNIEILDLSGQIGKDSIIRSDSLYLYSPADCPFRVTKSGTRLEIRSTCGETA